jgi:hypothetical protein
MTCSQHKLPPINFAASPPPPASTKYGHRGALSDLQQIFPETAIIHGRGADEATTRLAAWDTGDP